MCDFGEPRGHEPAFRRPAVVVSHEIINRFGSPVVVPVTRTARGYPTHVEIDDVLPVVSYAQCELIRVVAQDRLGRRLGTVPAATLSRIDLVLRRILGL
jgi:mRNA interferase MazF